MESILTSIKKLLGVAEDDTNFDTDIIIDINTELAELTQIGVGPSEGFVIEDKTALWTDFIPAKSKKLEFVKSYVHLNVKLVFDPPSSSAAIEAINRKIAKLEWRIQVEADTVISKSKEENQNE